MRLYSYISNFKITLLDHGLLLYLLAGNIAAVTDSFPCHLRHLDGVATPPHHFRCQQTMLKRIQDDYFYKYSMLCATFLISTSYVLRLRLSYRSLNPLSCGLDRPFFKSRIDNCHTISVESWKRIAELQEKAGTDG